jgi:methyl-accepting chemotaxis protein
MNQISESSNGITEIVTIIMNITDQINLPLAECVN